MGEHRQHRASYRDGPDGTWQGGCVICGVGFGERAEASVVAWCMGHDAAINRARQVAASVPPFFDPTGPGEAVTLPELRHVIDVAQSWLRHAGYDDVEVLQPADQVPWLHLWTPASSEGWHRRQLGGLYLERGGEFVPYVQPDVLGLPRR